MKKHILIAVIIAALANICTAQQLKDKVYFDEDWNVISDASKASYYRLYNANDKSTGLKPYKDFYINGILQGEGYYSRVEINNGLPEFTEEGEQKNYYENGQLSELWYKKNGKIDGKHTSYDSTGCVKQFLNYKNGVLDGKQVRYWQKNMVNVEDFFKNGILQNEVYYLTDGSKRSEYTLINRYENVFTANHTFYYIDEDDSPLSKVSDDLVFFLDPNVWEYPFQLSNFLMMMELGAERTIKLRNGKHQEFDRQERIVKDGNYTNGDKSGKWTYYLYSQKCYYIEDYDDDSSPKYYTLDHKPFSGPLTVTQSDGAEIFFNIKNGIRCGKYTVNHYDNNGKLYVKYFGNLDENGQIDGYAHSEIEVDGKWQTSDFSNYKHGFKHGESREIQGDSIIFCTYNNDLLEGSYEIRKVHSFKDFVKEKDSLRDLIIVGSFKNDNPHGTFEWRDNEGRITTKGYYTNGSQSGIWNHFYYDENMYGIVDHDKNVPDRFYTLDGKPFTGKHIQSFEKEEDDDPDTFEMTIKNSYVQEVKYIDSSTGKVLKINKYKDGILVE
ncbi:MAG: hypothetical protein J6Y24_10720 [Bacteroidales bacterium]|nr:hypothetical protein [Bacteroidales bacterium]